MAYYQQVLTGNSKQNARMTKTGMAQDTKHDKEQRLALELQRELVRRAQTPVGNDPMHSFDNSMSREQVAAQFMKLAQSSRESAFA
jgi:hypothetical protein